VWCSASKKRKAREYDVRGSPSPSKKSRPCAAASNKSDSASSDESEDADSDNESEGSEFIPAPEGTDAQDDSSAGSSYDSSDEALVEETQQYSLYVGYCWEDISHVVDCQVRSKSSVE
jgi:hypothetical protein